MKLTSDSVLKHGVLAGMEGKELSDKDLLTRRSLVQAMHTKRIIQEHEDRRDDLQSDVDEEERVEMNYQKADVVVDTKARRRCEDLKKVQEYQVDRKSIAANHEKVLHKAQREKTIANFTKQVAELTLATFEVDR